MGGGYRPDGLLPSPLLEAIPAVAGICSGMLILILGVADDLRCNVVLADQTQRARLRVR